MFVTLLGLAFPPLVVGGGVMFITPLVLSALRARRPRAATPALALPSADRVAAFSPADQPQVGRYSVRLKNKVMKTRPAAFFPRAVAVRSK